MAGTVPHVDVAQAPLRFAQPPALTEANSSKPDEAQNVAASSLVNLADTTKQDLFIVESEDGIRKHLKDADSATFKRVHLSMFEGHPVVCGQVNSKNSLGGFSGYQRFIAAGDAIDILQEEMEPREFVKAWNRMCVRK